MPVDRLTRRSRRCSVASATTGRFDVTGAETIELFDGAAYAREVARNSVPVGHSVTPSARAVCLACGLPYWRMLPTRAF